jgi:hypothetical protein
MSSTTPANVSIAVNPAGLSAATYSGTVTISSNQSLVPSVTISVSFTVGPPLILGASNLLFSQIPSGLSPPAQTASVSTGTSHLAYTVTTVSGGGWLFVTPTSGTTPDLLSVTANGSTLTPGSYSGTITVSAPGSLNSPQTITVTLTVGNSMTLSPSSLFFNGIGSSSSPIFVSANVPVANLSAVASSSGWLSVVPSTGSQTGNFTASVFPAGLVPGAYSGSITISATGVSNSPQTIPVTLSVPKPALTAPGNGNANVSLTPTLVWNSTPGATLYDIYFGTTFPPAFITSTTSTTYAPGALTLLTTYYWQVVARNGAASVASDTWSFTTAPSGPGIATHFLVTALPTATAGMPLSFKITALDASNNPVATYSDPVHFSSSDNVAILPADKTLTNGAGTFSATMVTTGSQTLTATDPFNSSVTGTSANIMVSAASGLSFIPITPCRVVDTRGNGFTGSFGPPFISGGSMRSFPIPSGACGTFANAQAYSFNVTVKPHAPLGFLTIWPSGQGLPVASTLNSRDGRVKANAAIVQTGTGGAISVFASDDTDVILDLNGYFVNNSTPGALAFYSMPPCRIADTRTGFGFTGSFGPPMLTPPSTPSGTSRTLPILSSSCNVPSTAQAYSLNITALPPGSMQWLTAWPTGQPQPVSSSLNDPTGTKVANAVIVPAGAGGSIDLYVHDNTNVLVDISGYFAPPGTGGLSLYGLLPCRALDTRPAQGGGGPFVGQLDVNVLGSGCGGTPLAQAYVFNATVVPPAAMNYLTLWAQAAAQPNTSTLNAADGAVTSNMAIVPTNNTNVSAFASSPTNLILDISGYFAP